MLSLTAYLYSDCFSVQTTFSTQWVSLMQLLKELLCPWVCYPYSQLRLWRPWEFRHEALSSVDTYCLHSHTHLRPTHYQLKPCRTETANWNSQFPGLWSWICVPRQHCGSSDMHLLMIARGKASPADCANSLPVILSTCPKTTNGLGLSTLCYERRDLHIIWSWSFFSEKKNR